MHPEADALLGAIFDHPDDDTPRLVYADWLQEHGHEDYAQFIRLSVQISRGHLRPDERAQLRQERFRLGQQIETAYPMACHVTRPKGRGTDGLPSRLHQLDAAVFLDGWPAWWPFVCPRVLRLHDAAGYETAVARCGYLPRLDALACEGTVLSGSSHRREELEWRPVASVLLHALAANTGLHKLTALKVEPLAVSADELRAFAGSSLAGRLEELDLWIQFIDGSHERLRASRGWVMHEITGFIAEHGLRLPALPA